MKKSCGYSSKLDYEEARYDRDIVYSIEMMTFTGELKNMVNFILSILFGEIRE